jgi:hypothetical protein
MAGSNNAIARHLYSLKEFTTNNNLYQSASLLFNAFNNLEFFNYAFNGEAT